MYPRSILMILLVLFAFFLLIMPVIHAQTWIQNGPYGSAMNTIQNCPADTSLLLLGTWRDGNWRSEDEGQTWHRASTGLEKERFGIDHPELTYLYSFKFLFQPNSRDTVYSLLYAGNLVRSTDAGLTWDLLPMEGIPDSVEHVGQMRKSSVYDVFMLPDRPVLYILLVYGGLYRSDSGGESWTQIEVPSDPEAIQNSCVDNFAYHPLRTSELYITTGGKFYRSMDEGLTWESMSDMDNRYYIRHSLIIDPDDDVLYAAAVQQPDFGMGYAMLKSLDGGSHWEKLSFPFFAIDGLTTYFTLHLTPQGEVIFMGGELYYVHDQGSTWEQIGGILEYLDYIPGQQFVFGLTVNPHNAESIYAATSSEVGTGFVWKSLDGGDNWNNVTPQIQNQRITQVYIPHKEPERVYVASHGALWESRDRGQSWDILSIRPNYRLAFFQDDPDLIYCGGSYLSKSRDGGRTWTIIEETRNLDFKNIAVHPTDSLFLIAKASLNYLVSHDGGNTWRGLSGVQYGSRIHIGFGDPSSETTFIVIDLVRIYRSQDKGLTWEEILFPYGTTDRIITSPLAKGVYVISGDSLYHTLDGDQYRSMSLPEGPTVFWWVLDNPFQPWLVSVTTDSGVYYTGDEGLSWTKIPESDLFSLSSRAVAIDQYGKVYMGTTNNGLWQLEDGVNVESGDRISLPNRFILEPSFPNPFNASVMITFQIPEEQEVRLAIFDLQGRLVRVLTNGWLARGRYHVSWNGADSFSSPVASGTYFVVLSSAGHCAVQRIIHLK